MTAVISPTSSQGFVPAKEHIDFLRGFKGITPRAVPQVLVHVQQSLVEEFGHMPGLNLERVRAMLASAWEKPPGVSGGNGVVNGHEKPRERSRRKGCNKPGPRHMLRHK
jgi:hypothetical protein